MRVPPQLNFGWMAFVKLLSFVASRLSGFGGLKSGRFELPTEDLKNIIHFSVSCPTCVAKIDQPRVLSQLSVLTSNYSLQNQRSPTSSRASGYWFKTNEKIVKAHLAMFLYPGWSSYPWEGGAKSEPG